MDIEASPPKGLLTGEPGELVRRTVRAWEIFADIAATVDLDGPTRSRRRTARQMIIGVGTWHDSRGIAQLAADAHAGATTTESMRSSAERLVRSHQDESDEEVLSCVRRSLEVTRDWLTSDDLHLTGLLTTPSPLGPAPMGTVVHAAAYHLAVTARDLVPAGAPLSPELDELGIVALIDATGAVAARTGLTARACAVGRRTEVSCSISDGGWTMALSEEPDFPAVIAPEELLVDLAGGRADFAAITRQLRFRDARGMLALAPVVDAIPELPGGPLLKRVAAFSRFLVR